MSNILDKPLYPSYISKATLIHPPSDYEDISSGVRKPTNKGVCNKMELLIYIQSQVIFRIVLGFDM